jgi:hypothetical protein
MGQYYGGLTLQPSLSAKPQLRFNPPKQKQPQKHWSPLLPSSSASAFPIITAIYEYAVSAALPLFSPPPSNTTMILLYTHRSESLLALRCRLSVRQNACLGWLAGGSNAPGGAPTRNLTDGWILG